MDWKLSLKLELMVLLNVYNGGGSEIQIHNTFNSIQAFQARADFKKSDIPTLI